MQQTNSYWRVLGVTCVLGAFVASACVVTTSTDDSVAGGAGIAAVGGGTSIGTGGAAGASTTSGGAGSAGNAGTSGSAGSAGNSLGLAGSGGAAGTGAVAFQCDPVSGTTQGTPSTCAPDSANACSLCIQAKCCTEFSDCYATKPGNQCGWGGPKGEGEIVCFQSCVIEATSNGRVVDSELLGTCAGQCGTANDTSGMACQATIGQQTNDLVGCINGGCSSECFGS